MYHGIENVDLMKENVTQINGKIMANIDVNVKSVMYVKKIMFGILLHVVMKIEKHLASVMVDLAIMRDEIIGS